MLASLSQAVYLLNAPIAQVARLAGALQAKAESDPSILAGGAGTPAPAVDEASNESDEPVTETDESADEADGHVGAEDSSAESTESEDPTEA
jgi:large subunit ribosomal protein L10